MSNRNFDSNFIIQRQRDLNDANNLYKTQQEGHAIISHPQNTDTSLARILNFHNGSQTFYLKNEIGGGHTISLGGIANLLGDEKEEELAIPPTSPLFLNATIISPTQVSISFVPGKPGNTEIVNYQYSINGVKTFKSFNPPITSSPVIIGGLEIGKSYEIGLRSTTVYAASEPSYITILVAYVPSTPPVITSFTENNTSVTINLFPPSNTGGAPIIGYEYSLDGVSFNEIYTIDLTNIVVINLTNGVIYNIYVRAKNVKGHSPHTMITAMPSTIPTPPLNVSATSYNQYVTINWNIPSYDGGTPILDYQIYRNNTLISTVSDLTFTYNSTGLTNGVTYEFYVLARNKNGTSSISNKVSSIPSTIPDTPTITYIVPNNNGAYLYFIAGNYDGGSQVTSYQYTTDNGTSFTDLGNTQLLSPLAISGLTNGSTSIIQIKAVNIKGASLTWSTGMSVIPSASTTQSAWIIINPNNLVSYGGNNSLDVKNIGTDSLITGTLSSTPGGTPTVGYVTDTISGRKVFDFNGTSYIFFDTNTNFGNTFTVTAWIYPRDKTSTNMLFSNGNSGNSQPGFKMGWNIGGTNNKEISFEGVNTQATRIVTKSPQNTIELNKWQHVAYVFNKTSRIILMYKNGIPVSIEDIYTASSIPTSSNTFVIGGTTNYNNLMNAQLGFLRVFNTDLNAANVYADFNGSRSQFGL